MSNVLTWATYLGVGFAYAAMIAITVGILAVGVATIMLWIPKRKR